MLMTLIRYGLILAVFVLIASAGADCWRAVKQRDAGQVAGGAALSCIAITMLGLIGMLAPEAAAVLGVASLATAAGIAYAAGGSVSSLAGEAGAAFGRLGADLRGLTARLRPAGDDAPGPVLAAPAPAAAATPPVRAQDARPPTRGAMQQPAIRARRVAAAAGIPAIAAGWAGVVAGVADFDPESNVVYIEWLREQVTGVAATAEAFVEQHEAMIHGIGVDPVALATRHEVAEAFITCAETIARSGSAFCQHFELPDAFVDAGGILANEGRWHQGSPE